MRDDTLAMLLLRSNVQSHGRYLLLEATNGLVAAAMAQRMDGWLTWRGVRWLLGVLHCACVRVHVHVCV